MPRGITALVVLIFAVTAREAFAQQKTGKANEGPRQKTIKFEGRTWVTSLAREVTVEQYKGKKALHVLGREQAYVYLPDVEFQDGVIEADIAGAIFSGIGFRGRDNGTKAEKVYFRPQNAGTKKHEKTVQYAAMGRRDGTWNYFRKNFPGKYESGAALKKNAWFHAKLIIKGTEVKVYVNDGKEPVLVVTDMRYGESKGTVGVWGWNSYFANFRYKASDTLVGSAPADVKAGPDGASRRPRVVYTKAHGEVSRTRRLAKLAGNMGIDFIPFAKPITPDVLQKAEALYILLPRKSFTAGEKAAIVAFLKRGGSLLLVADQQMRMRLEKTGANGLIVPFGLKLTEDTPYLHNCGAIARKGEINKEDREIPYSGGRAVTGGTPFSFILDAEGNATELAHGAFTKTAAGSRIIVLGDAMASLFMGTPHGKRLTGSKPSDTTYWGKDSAAFIREVLEWLTGVVPQTTE